MNNVRSGNGPEVTENREHKFVCMIENENEDRRDQREERGRGINNHESLDVVQISETTLKESQPNRNEK